MLDLKFAYLFASCLFLIWWIVLFILCRPVRRNILLVSLFFGLGAVISGYLWWTKDWWHPQTITGTIIGIEDFILGFSNAGVALALAHLASNVPGINREGLRRLKIMHVLLLLLSMSIITGFCIWILGLSSISAAFIGMLALLVVVILIEPKLKALSFLVGLSMVIFSVPIYLITLWVFPEFISQTWTLSGLSGVGFFQIPVEDLIYYFLFGASVGVASFLVESNTSTAKTHQ